MTSDEFVSKHCIHHGSLMSNIEEELEEDEDEEDKSLFSIRD